MLSNRLSLVITCGYFSISSFSILNSLRVNSITSPSISAEYVSRFNFSFSKVIKLSLIVLLLLLNIASTLLTSKLNENGFVI